MTVKIDVGFWSYGDTSDGRVYVQSEDFEHDVRLYIDGDFDYKERKMKYAEGIAFMLNNYVLSNPDLTEMAEKNVPAMVAKIVKEGHEQYKLELEG